MRIYWARREVALGSTRDREKETKNERDRDRERQRDVNRVGTQSKFVAFEPDDGTHLSPTNGRVRATGSLAWRKRVDSGRVTGAERMR